MVRHSTKKEPSPNVGISIPRSLADEIKPILKPCGYVSLSDLVRDLLRDFTRTVNVIAVQRKEEESKIKK